MFEEIKLKSKYSISLILSTAKRKTCPALSAEWDTSADSMLRMLEHQATTTKELLDLAKKFFGEKTLFLIIDDSLIKKTYSKFIERTSDNYNSADRKQYRSLCSIVAMLADGIFALPIDQKIWTSEEFAVIYKKRLSLRSNYISTIHLCTKNSLEIFQGIIYFLYFHNYVEKAYLL